MLNEEFKKIKFGGTFTVSTEKVQGELNTTELNFLNASKIKVASFDITCKSECLTFDTVEEGLKHKKNWDLVFRFIEYQNAEGHPRILYIFPDCASQEYIAVENIYGIGFNWKLYMNSKNDIVAQHLEFPTQNITIRYRAFPSDDEFYLYLSCLIYTLKNSNTHKESEIRNLFDDNIKALNFQKKA